VAVSSSKLKPIKTRESTKYIHLKKGIGLTTNTNTLSMLASILAVLRKNSRLSLKGMSPIRIPEEISYCRAARGETGNSVTTEVKTTKEEAINQRRGHLLTWNRIYDTGREAPREDERGIQHLLGLAEVVG
jgi:hypothetical protein